MKEETVLDVLMYLFENYLDEETEVQPDRETLRVELEAAGFPGGEVKKAFNWLEALAEDAPAPDTVQTPQAVRIYSAEECIRLDVESRGFLIYLEQIGILSAAQRELVVDRIMALETDEIDIDQVKWIILMVLFNQPGQELAYARMEDLVLEEQLGLVH